MFALQLSFKDHNSKPELLYIGQPELVVSGESVADLVIEDLKRTRQSVHVKRRLGRHFEVRHRSANGDLLNELDCEFMGSIDLNFAILTVIALDADLRGHGHSSFEKAGIQAFQEAISFVTQPFPAVVVKGKQDFQLSLGNLNQIFVGRAAGCDLRLSHPEISGKHARFGLETGFIWAEDLGSTNGTFIAGRQISGRVNLDYAAPVILGRDLTISVVRNSDELQRSLNQSGSQIKPTQVRYPVLCAYSSVARPSRLELAPGSRFTIGRDPKCDLWLGAPHVSRQHSEVVCEADGSITFIDRSTNGTAYSRGILRTGEQLKIVGDAEIFNFGNELTLAVCFNEEQENLYRASKGSFAVFVDGGVEMLSKAAVSVDEVPTGELAALSSEENTREYRSKFGSITNAEISFKNPRQLLTLLAMFVLTVAVVVAVAGVVVSFFR